jgi:membrane dipeptidase
VRHLQLVHFMPSDLGDNQTESPAHGGLTAFGRDVIAECNRLGIVVDVAHGTLAMVEGARAREPDPTDPVAHQPRVAPAGAVSRG